MSVFKEGGVMDWSALELTSAAASDGPRGLDRVANLAAPLAQIVKVASSDPNKELQDLQLTPALVEVLAHPFQELGFRLDKIEVQDPGNNRRWVSAAKRDGLQLLLLHIPAWILDNPGNGNLEAVGLLGWCFDRETTLYLWSEKGREYDFSFENMFKRWKQLGIRTIFVSWRRVEELKKLRPEDQKARLLSMLDLDGLPSQAGAPAGSLDRLKANAEAVKRLRRILSDLADAALPTVGASGYFRNLVQRSNLPKGWKQELADAWHGPSDDMAEYLIQWLITKRENTVDPRYTALAAVIEELLESVGMSDRQFLIQNIVDYNLITEPSVIADLRQKYPG